MLVCLLADATGRVRDVAFGMVLGDEGGEVSWCSARKSRNEEGEEGAEAEEEGAEAEVREAEAEEWGWMVRKWKSVWWVARKRKRGDGDDGSEGRRKRKAGSGNGRQVAEAEESADAEDALRKRRTSAEAGDRVWC